MKKHAKKASKPIHIELPTAATLIYADPKKAPRKLSKEEISAALTIQDGKWGPSGDAITKMLGTERAGMVHLAPGVMFVRVGLNLRKLPESNHVATSICAMFGPEDGLLVFGDALFVLWPGEPEHLFDQLNNEFYTELQAVLTERREEAKATGN